MIKSKPCTVYGCGRPRFAKGYCTRHQSLRTDDKKPKGIKKISEKGKANKVLKKDLVQNDMAFYLQLWNEREHICFETGRYLGNKPLITMFHHVLPKATYPQFRHCAWNIVFLLPEIHNQVETKLSMCPKVEAYTNELKQKYEDKELDSKTDFVPTDMDNLFLEEI